MIFVKLIMRIVILAAIMLTIGVIALIIAATQGAL